MSITVNFKMIAATIAASFVAFMIATERADQYVHFQSELNAAGTFFCAGFLALCSAINCFKINH